MKRLSVPLVVLTLLVLPCGSLQGQSNGVVPFLGGGLAMGTGSLSTDTNNGWLAFGGVDVPLDAWPGLSPQPAVERLGREVLVGREDALEDALALGRQLERTRAQEALERPVDAGLVQGAPSELSAPG